MGVPVAGQWTQWGGPDRNFSVESGSISIEWPESGPPVLWTRELGEGFSSVLRDGDRLYTLRHEGNNDIVVCLEASTGETLWETPYESPILENMIIDFGEGPISTPLISGDRIFTVSLTAKFHCLDKKSGEILWSHDLMAEMQASHQGRGYGPSPIAYGDNVIVNVGGKETGFAAFDQTSGEVVWKTGPYGGSYSSPILVDFEGEDQLIVSGGNHRAGLNPKTGEVLWHLELPRAAGAMMSTQHFGKDHLLFGSAAYGDGSRVISVSRGDDGAYSAEEVLFSKRMKVMYAPYVRIGDYIYGSSGGFGPSFLMGFNLKTGKVAWRKRGFARAAMLHADGKLIILDEDGTLAIATASPDGLTVHSRANGVLSRTAWTPPTLVGTTLYLRNRSIVKALDLSVSGQ